MKTANPTARPWWHYGHVWMVIAGPAIVVCAGIATLVLAVRAPDPLVNVPHRIQSTGAQTPAEAHEARVMVPAVQGRNHAATPVDR